MEKQDLALWIVNDPEAGLRAAMEQHAPAVKGILNRILPGRPEDVEECMADVFVALWKNARRLCQSGAPVKAWLVVTARNTGINRYRALRRREELPLTEELAQALADLPPDPGSDAAEAAQLLGAVPSDAETLVCALVGGLPSPDREIFLRKYYLLESTRQIAGALGMSEGSVNTRLTRGRQRLRRQLEEKGVRIHEEL